MGSDARITCNGSKTNYFNPRSRMGSDPLDQLAAVQDPISIHAPAWGATPSISWLLSKILFQSTLPHGERPVVRFALAVRVISIHAPAWGATGLGRFAARNRLFQSTLPHGERRVASHAADQARRISIHAPAWGATERGHALLLAGRISIHAPAWGATSSPNSHPNSKEFQSTLPHGERPSTAWLR